MKKVKSLEEFVSLMGTTKEFWYDRSGTKYKISMVEINQMKFKDVISLILHEGLFINKKSSDTGRHGQGAPGSYEYFSMAD